MEQITKPQGRNEVFYAAPCPLDRCALFNLYRNMMLVFWYNEIGNLKFFPLSRFLTNCNNSDRIGKLLFKLVGTKLEWNTRSFTLHSVHIVTQLSRGLVNRLLFTREKVSVHRKINHFSRTESFYYTWLMSFLFSYI